jgi:hypothetical protein
VPLKRLCPFSEEAVLEGPFIAPKSHYESTSPASSPLPIDSRNPLRSARLIGRRRAVLRRGGLPCAEPFVVCFHALVVHARAYLCGFASTRAHVQEREDGADKNADADDDDHEGEAVRAARCIVVCAVLVALVERGGEEA